MESRIPATIAASRCSINKRHAGVYGSIQHLRRAVRKNGRRRDDDHAEVGHQSAAWSVVRIPQEREVEPTTGSPIRKARQNGSFQEQHVRIRGRWSHFPAESVRRTQQGLLHAFARIVAERALGGERRTLPTPDQIKGDFSKFLNGADQPVTIYDPLTTRLGADGKTLERTAFAGNMIPTSRINPIAAKGASFIRRQTCPAMARSISTTMRNCPGTE